MLKNNHISEGKYWILGKTIELGIFFLIFFTPIAFSTVDEWSEAIMEGVVFLIFIVWIIKMYLEQNFNYVRTPLDLLIILYIAVIAFQLIPLPVDVVKIFSPHSAELVTYYLSDTSANLRFIKLSIVPWATQVELLKVLTYAMLYFVVVNNFGTFQKLGRLFVAIAIIGGIESVYGLIQYLSGDKMLFRFSNIDYPMDRLVGTFPNPDHFSAYLKMCIFSVFGYLLYIGDFSRGRSRNDKRKSKVIDKLRKFFFSDKKWEIKFSLLITIVLMITAVIFSKSRLGMLSLVITFICFAVIMRIKVSSRLAFSVAALILIITIAIGTWIGMTPVFDRYINVDPNFELEEGRLSIWASTYDMFLDFPILGSGSGSFVYMYPSYSTRNNQGWVSHAHNDWLELLSDTGIVGFGIVLSGLFIITFKEFFKIFMTKEKQLIWMFLGTYMAIFSLAIHCISDFNLKAAANSFLLVVITAIFMILGKSTALNEKNIDENKS